MALQNVATFPMLVRQHSQDAAFLFEQRARAFHAHSWDDDQLGRCDQRLSAHLAGLVAAGQAGWETAQAYAADNLGAGEAFVVGALAFAQSDEPLPAIAPALDGPDGLHGLSGALAWSEAVLIGPFVRDWLSSTNPSLRLFALMALSHHRQDPGPLLETLLNDPDPLVRSRAARLAFELGSAKNLPLLREMAGDPANDDPWPLLAVVRLGDRADGLFEYASGPARPKAALALDVALLAAPAQGKERLGELMQRPTSRALAMSRTGVLADRTIMPWLTGRMRDADDAEAAAFAFLDLFPLDPDHCGLFTENPDLLGGDFEGRDPGLYPIAEKIESWVKTTPTAASHRSLRSQMLAAMRAGLQDRSVPLAKWRARRSLKVGR